MESQLEATPNSVCIGKWCDNGWVTHRIEDCLGNVKEERTRCRFCNDEFMLENFGEDGLHDN